MRAARFLVFEKNSLRVSWDWETKAGGPECERFARITLFSRLQFQCGAPGTFDFERPSPSDQALRANNMSDRLKRLYTIAENLEHGE